MSELLGWDRLLRGCSDSSFDDGLLIETELVPAAGRGALSKFIYLQEPIPASGCGDNP